MDFEVAITVQRGDEELVKKLDQEGKHYGGRLVLRESPIPTILLAPPVLENLDLLDQEIYIAEYSLCEPAAGYLNSFSIFEKLSKDLQNKIFTLRLPGPRIVDVATKHDTKGNFLKVKLGVHPIATALLHVNRRARDLARGRYTPCFRGKRRNPIYFSWAHDTLYFNDAQAFLEFSGQLPEVRSVIPKWIKIWQNHIQHLTFEHKEWNVASGAGETTRIGRLVTNMPSLKTITITIDTWKLEQLPAYLSSLNSWPPSVEKVVLEGWMRKRKTEQEVERFVEELEIQEKLRELWVYKGPAASITEELNEFLRQCDEDTRLRKLLDAQVKVQRPKVIYERKGVMRLKANAGYITLNAAQTWMGWAEISFPPLKLLKNYQSPWFDR
ncbi:hypothetical protein BDZ45DRAFT_774522 [Acephala macrosclerotiorum]|nr:hypothetical protein BDZ45DRAFT_774522 [Acephala macrosclerotiorum]